MTQVKGTAAVAGQEKLAEGVYSMWIDADPVAAQAKAGQFVSLYSGDGARLLPRPISICETDKEKGRIRLVYRVAGAGTEEFSRYPPNLKDSGSCPSCSRWYCQFLCVTISL